MWDWVILGLTFYTVIIVPYNLAINRYFPAMFSEAGVSTDLAEPCLLIKAWSRNSVSHHVKDKLPYRFSSQFVPAMAKAVGIVIEKAGK